MSVAGGLENAILAGACVGCDCLQIFVKNQRQWSAPPLTDEKVRAFHRAAADTGLSPVVAHATYLLNFASPVAATRRRSVRTMIDELERCERLGVAALIFHPGSHLDDGELRMANQEWRMTGAEHAAIERIAASLNDVHVSCPGYRARILLETTAGQGTAIGYRFEHLGEIIASVREPGRLGVCLDTCHLFAAGYDFRTRDGYDATIDALDRAIGVSLVKCIHTNDSKRDCGSRVDRHEHIGKGRIGKRGFAHFLNDPRFREVPFILETPKGTDGRGTKFDKLNLKRLRLLVLAR